jgi:hypothetical protein
MGEDKEQRSKRSGGLFFPLLLIAIGLIFLLKTIGMLEGDLLDTVLKLWPILLILVGMDGIYKREGVATGVPLIGIGVIFLLANYGYLSVNIWQMMFTLWPLVLIAIGFDIFISRRSLWLSIIGVLLILVILAGSLWLFENLTSEQNALAGQVVSQTLNGVTQAEIVIEPGVGSLNIDKLSDSNDLIAGTISTSEAFRLDETYSREEGTATYSLKTTGNAQYIPVYSGGTWTWNLGLTPELPMSLDLNLGAGFADLNLSDLEISNLKSVLGVGMMSIVLPDEGDFIAKIDGAVGKVDVMVPEGLEVRIRSELGLATLRVPPSYLDLGEIYTSPGFDRSENQVELDIEMGIGVVTIQEVP